MIAGLSGSLLSHDLLCRLLRDPAGMWLAGAGSRERGRLRAWHASVRGRLGPTSGPRLVYDVLAEPLAHALGFTLVPVADDGGGRVAARLQVDGTALAVLVATGWGEAPSATWRHAVHRALAERVRWCLCVSGRALRVYDALRAYARRYAEFDLELAFEDPHAFNAFWGLLHASALQRAPGGVVLDRVVELCERHRAAVGISLRKGVHDALIHLIGAFGLASRRHADAPLLDESLIVVYRMLFLLFAEARGLVPRWHPVYRESYTLDALQRALERRNACAGVWESLQAMSRLAHRGCRAGTLRVTPFNGRLFSPADAPLAESLPLDDRAVARALMALTTRTGAEGLERISYADLGVEQLGSVYEHLLDFDISRAAGPGVLVRTGRRKATGSFYTPRSLTEFLVRRTLAPLTAAATPEGILALRVLDPAMGSGAFLVAACRYLAAAYEQALVREGLLSPADIEDDDRAAFRRAVAQRCLFGVDLNPMAVQLGRLSLWLATLAADKPLTFLDHRLRPGNSLVGASLADMLRHGSPGGRRGARADLPLFEGDALSSSLEPVVGARLAMARTPDDSIEQVRGKERALASLGRPDGPLAPWQTAADLWCSAWYTPPPRPARATFRALVGGVLRQDTTLPPHVAAPILAGASRIARQERFFHWTLEFPEVFHDDTGAPLPGGGFHAILGNPPWDMLRDEEGARRAPGFADFVRGAGLYSLQGGGHGNLYQLFLERALRLLKPGGRAGFILPSGFATDHACAALRAHVFTRTAVDTFTTVENRDGIFPIHRGLKFVLLTLTSGGTTPEIPTRSGVRSPATLDLVPDTGRDPAVVPVPRALVERISGESLAVPEVRGRVDLDIVSRIAFQVPAAADTLGWHIRFGRELNVTDDRPHFTTGPGGLAVLEGKGIRPFEADVEACRFRIPAAAAGRLLDAGRTFRRARLGYREVASAGNRLTLIAAIVPAGVVTCHTVFCLKTPLDREAQEFLCGVFNSYVANYLVRMRVSTHVTAAIIGSLAVPRPARDDTRYRQVAALSRRLARSGDSEALARLNALVAALYGVSAREFAHILETFPLVPAPERAAALAALESGP